MYMSRIASLSITRPLYTVGALWSRESHISRALLTQWILLGFAVVNCTYYSIDRHPTGYNTVKLTNINCWSCRIPAKCQPKHRAISAHFRFKPSGVIPPYKWLPSSPSETNVLLSHTEWAIAIFLVISLWNWTVNYHRKGQSFCNGSEPKLVPQKYCCGISKCEQLQECRLQIILSCVRKSTNKHDLSAPDFCENHSTK